MKTYNLLIIKIFLLLASLAVIIGCKYDVAEPPWDKPYTPPPTAVIDSIAPPIALAGINTITIFGQNFANSLTDNQVLFSKLVKTNEEVVVSAEVISASSTSIVVRRPNILGDSTSVKVNSYNTYTVVKEGPYRIDTVVWKYGTFIEKLELSVLAVDNAENLYVVERSSRKIWKVTPNGQKTTIGTIGITGTLWDAKIGSDGRLYYLYANKIIRVVDLQSGADVVWHNSAASKTVRFFDFDQNGYIYAGGYKTGLVVVRPDSSTRLESFYASDTISSVRVFNGYVYIAAVTAAPDANNPRLAIFRHSLADTAQIGSKELILDLTKASFTISAIKSFTFSADGKYIYIGTDAPADPILRADLSTNSVDILYKGILPSSCKQFHGGIGNYIYMINGNTPSSTNANTTAEDWTVYKLDIGTTSAPYY